MKRIIALACVLGLAGCAPPPPEPSQIIWDHLTKLGYHVVDVTRLETHIDNNGNSSPPRTLCYSAVYGAAFRAFAASGATVLGVACLEQDNSITIPLQK
jgi:hypothetical protein